MRRFVSVLVSLLFCAFAGAQEVTDANARPDSVRLRYVVSGTVLDGETGRKLESVHVSLPDRHYATVTNADGAFSIKSENG